MGTLKERVEVELENVERALAELPVGQTCSSLSRLELAGVAALLHSFYNGIENVLLKPERVQPLVDAASGVLLAFRGDVAGDQGGQEQE